MTAFPTRSGVATVADHTPTIGEVRDTYADDQAKYRGRGVENAYADFDRWLADHDRRVRAEALRNAAPIIGKSHVEVALGGADYVRGWLTKRANMIERGDQS